MSTEEREEAQVESELSPMPNGTQKRVALHARIAPHFRRAEARERARRFLKGLLAAVRSVHKSEQHQETLLHKNHSVT